MAQLDAHLWTDVLRFFGVDDMNGRGYAFFSGPGSDISELASFGALTALVRHRNCHVRGCFRLAHHDLPDPQTAAVHRVCHKHHPLAPDRGVTKDHLERLWAHHKRSNHE